VAGRDWQYSTGLENYPAFLATGAPVRRLRDAGEKSQRGDETALATTNLRY